MLYLAVIVCSIMSGMGRDGDVEVEYEVRDGGVEALRPKFGSDRKDGDTLERQA